MVSCWSRAGLVLVSCWSRALGQSGAGAAAAAAAAGAGAGLRRVGFSSHPFARGEKPRE